MTATILESTPLPFDPRREPTLASGVAAALRWMDQQQNDEGFWVGMLESNCCMEAEWLLAMHFLGMLEDPKVPGVTRAILQQQRPDGSWEVYHGASGGDINTTVECYAALRAAGQNPGSEPLRRARQWIMDRGGLRDLRNFTKYWLALVGEWPWDQTPTLPPEMMFLPAWCPFNIYQFASWGRGTIVPLAVLSARRPVRPLPADRRLDELFPEGRDRHDYRLPRRHNWLSWEGPFYAVDQALRRYVGFPFQPGREMAIRLCLEWMLRHQDSDGAWSGIQPPWIYSLMALHVEGYPTQHAVMRAGLRAFDSHWKYQRHGTTRLQASESPIWDTALSLLAMLDCGCDASSHPGMRRALDWLLDKEETRPGDWAMTAPDVPPGGWAFQRANRFYPDVDDTAVILLVLARLRKQLTDPAAVAQVAAAIDRGLRWVLGMQCRNGGWAAFDRDNTHFWLTKIPFADYGELLDPPSADVTAHVVEALAELGYARDHHAVARALEYLRREQEDDGSWFGRWGVNHIYGTAAVLPALRAIGIDMREPWVRKAADWIVAHQNDDGGWGESCASYMDDALRGIGPSTASQTGWALMALTAMDSDNYHPALRRGVAFLLARQTGGTWDEPEYTGTGFPGYGVGQRIDLSRQGHSLGQDTDLQRAFMINYNLYRHYFPLMAMGRAQRILHD